MARIPSSTAPSFAMSRRQVGVRRLSVLALLAALLLPAAVQHTFAGSTTLQDLSTSAAQRRASKSKASLLASANAADASPGSKSSAGSDSKITTTPPPKESETTTATESSTESSVSKASSSSGTLKKPDRGSGSTPADLIRESNPLGKDRVTAAEIEAGKATKSIQELSDQLRQKNDEYILLQRNLKQKLELAPNMVERRRLGDEINRLRIEFNRTIAPIRNEMKERVRELRQTVPDLNKPIGAGNEGGRPRRGNP